MNVGQLPGFRLKPIRQDLAVAIIAAALFSIESWALGPLSWIYGYGSGLETIPALKALTFDHRNLSLWSPFVAGGIDRLAFWGNANPFGPEYFLFSNMPVWAANGLHRFLQYFIAVFFASRVAEEQLGLSDAWRFVAGIMFGCFSYFTVGAMFTLPGVPLMLYLLQRSVGPGGGHWKAAASALLLSFTTTFTFGIPYLLTFAALWLPLVQRLSIRDCLGHFATFSVVLMAATAPQLLAIAVNAPASHRAAWDLEPVSVSIDGLLYRELQFDLFSQSPVLKAVTMNLPWLGIIAGAFFAVLAWRRGGEARQHGLKFFWVAFVFVLVSQKWAWLLLQLGVAQVAPFARGVYMGRFFQIPGPFLIAAALTLALRLAWILLQERRAARLALALTTGVFMVFMLIAPKLHLNYDLGVGDWGQANYEVRAIEELRARKELFRVASVLPLQPAYAYAQGLETVDGWANIYPSVYRDLWLRVLAPLFQELPYNREIFGADTGRAEDNFIFLGADLVHPGIGLLPGEDPMVALKTGFDVDRRFNFNLLRLLNVRYLLSEYPLRGNGIQMVHAADPWPSWPEYRSRNTGLVQGARPPSLVDFGRLRSVLDPLWNHANAIQRKLRGKDVFIYEIVGSFDRFRLVDTVLLEPDGKGVLDRLASMDSALLRTSAVLETADGASLTRREKLSGGRIDVVSYAPDRIELSVAVGGDAFLVIANTWSPFWKVTVDGVSKSLIRTNHSQYGLALPAGAHAVTLNYRPPYARFLPTVSGSSANEH